MKELNQQPKTLHEVVITQKKQQEVELQYTGSIKPHRNHKVWEINLITFEVKEAEYIQEKQIFFGSNLEHLPPRKIIMNPNCFYIAALNAKTALKRYTQNKGSAGIKEGLLKLK